MNTDKKNNVDLACCSICKIENSIYRCPRCMTRTCSLRCCLTHKEKNQCNGKRNRVGFVPLHQYTDSTLSSDFHFLEDVLAKSERGKRLIKDIGATVRNHSSSHNGGTRGRSNSNRKRRKIEDCTKAKTDDKGGCLAERKDDIKSIPIPIQPLLRLKVDGDGEKKSQQKNEIKLDETLNDSTTMQEDDAISTAVSSHQNQMIQEKSSSSSTIPFVKLSEEEELRLTRYPPHKQKLVRQAHQRGITLLLMAPGMQRHLMNKSTKFDPKKDLIYWKVEFIVHTFSSDGKKNDLARDNNKSRTLTITADRIPETEPILNHLSKLIQRNTSHSAMAPIRSTLLQFCCTSHTKMIKENVCALLKRIPCKSSQPSYRKIDLTDCLRDLLKGTTVIEFPTIEIVLDEDLHHFPIFISEIE